MNWLATRKKAAKLELRQPGYAEEQEGDKRSSIGRAPTSRSSHKRVIAAAMSSLLLSSAISTAVNAASKKTGKVTKTAVLSSSFAPYPPMLNPIRIGINCRAPLARFALWTPGYIFLNGQPVFPLQPGVPYTIQNGRVSDAAGHSFTLPGDARVHVTSSDYRVWTSNRWYRGCLELINLGTRVTVINLLDMEDYLLGVVPSEMPASWHQEALKSQAVAARSYAWAHQGRGSKWQSEGYDLVPDVRDQCYKGLAAEAQSTFNAVQMTRGLILKDSGRVKPGFYRATVGDNPFENLNIRIADVPMAKLEQITGVSKIVGVTVKRWDANGNAHTIQVMGQKKTREVYGIALAKMLNFQTAGILDAQEVNNVWRFTYRGPGNGARGLSQHGANTLASHGWQFHQILQQYYQDADGQLRLDYMSNYRAPTMPPPVALVPAKEK